MNLSIVTAGRNDDYGGNYVERMNRALETWLPLGCEIIMVEWNPPKDREGLQHAIRYKGIRLITVAPDVHSWQHGADLFEMFEYRAKNVGIRRAAGDWILCLNSDIMLTECMRKRLQSGFDPQMLYLTDRQDMDGDKIVQTVEAPGDFVLMRKNRWMELTGYLDLVTYTHLDSLLIWNAIFQMGMDKENLHIPVIHNEHDRSQHKARWGIHSSDIRRFIGQKNDEGWGLMDVTLSDRMI